jgi:hypothetical protein
MQCDSNQACKKIQRISVRDVGSNVLCSSTSKVGVRAGVIVPFHSHDFETVNRLKLKCVPPLQNMSRAESEARAFGYLLVSVM